MHGNDPKLLPASKYLHELRRSYSVPSLYKSREACAAILGNIDCCTWAVGGKQPVSDRTAGTVAAEHEKASASRRASSARTHRWACRVAGCPSLRPKGISRPCWYGVACP